MSWFFRIFRPCRNYSLLGRFRPHFCIEFPNSFGSSARVVLIWDEYEPETQNFRHGAEVNQSV